MAHRLVGTESTQRGGQRIRIARAKDRSLDAHLDRFYSTYISQHETADHLLPNRIKRTVRDESKRRCMKLLRSLGAGDRMLSVGTGDGAELGIAIELGFHDNEGCPQTACSFGERRGRQPITVGFDRFLKL